MKGRVIVRQAVIVSILVPIVSLIVFTPRCSAAPSASTVVPFGIGTITAQPASTNIDVGSPAFFSVAVATNSPVAYQWRFNGQPLPGETNSTLLIPSVATNNAGVYSVWMTNQTTILVSDRANLTIPGFPPVLGGGNILLSNKAFGVDAPIGDYFKGGPAGSDFAGQFYAGPSITNMVPVGLPAVFNAGYIDCGTVTLSNVPPGEKVFVQLYAWYGPEFFPFNANLIRGKSKFVEVIAGADPAPLSGLETFQLVHTDSYYWVPLYEGSNGTYNGALNDGTLYQQFDSVAQLGKPSTNVGPTGITIFNYPHNFSYLWTRDGKLLDGLVSGRIDFPNPTLSDAGNYRLFVHDDIDTAVFDFNVSVDVTPPQLFSGPIIFDIFNHAHLKLVSFPGRSYRIDFSHDMKNWSLWRFGYIPQATPTVELDFWTALDNDGGNHTNTPFGFFRALVSP